MKNKKIFLILTATLFLAAILGMIIINWDDNYKKVRLEDKVGIAEKIFRDALERNEDTIYFLAIDGGNPSVNFMKKLAKDYPSILKISQFKEYSSKDKYGSLLHKLKEIDVFDIKFLNNYSAEASCLSDFSGGGATYIYSLKKLMMAGAYWKRIYWIPGGARGRPNEILSKTGESSDVFSCKRPILLIDTFPFLGIIKKKILQRGGLKNYED